MSEEKGFTLVELIVVIAVIGIISTIGIASFTNYIKIARDSVRKSHLTEIEKYLESYYALNGKYPPAGSCPYGTAPLCTVNSTSSSAVWIPALSMFTDKLPKDPINNASDPTTTGNYSYSYGNVTSDGQNYDLTAQLENRADPDRCGLKGYRYSILDLVYCAGDTNQFSLAANTVAASSINKPCFTCSNFLIEVGPPNVFR